MNSVPEEVAKLSPEQKRALLAQLLKEKTSKQSEIYPCSYGQKALWFLYQLAPESWAYNIVFTARIRSEVDVSALQQAFQSLVDRHPALRTTFCAPEEIPVQRIHARMPVDFEVVNATLASDFNVSLVEQSRRSFDLERGPLLRVKLFVQGAQNYVLLIAMHHIIGDGVWSLAVLLDELRVLYPAQSLGVLASLPVLEQQYTDYVRWQTEMLAGSEGERLQHYWREQLAGELPVLQLPTDRPRPPVQTYEGAGFPLVLDRELTDQIKALAQREGATLYMTLLAAFVVLLHRYTAQEEIVVGSPMASRGQAAFAQVVGYFVNLIALRTAPSGGLTFKAFLAQVRQTVLGALAHQDFPFALLVEKLQPRRDPSRTPLFQVSFALQKLQRLGELSKFFVQGTADTLDFGGLKLEPLALSQQEGQFDLSLEMGEVDGALSGVLLYNTNLFDRETIARMAQHLSTLLQAITATPERYLAELPLIEHFSPTRIPETFAPTDCLHRLFEAQVQRTPDAVAAVYQSETLTYCELNRRSNQLAHHLKSLGVGPEVPVGLCLERSPAILVAILATLKAGGAYLPLDPSYPEERLTFLLGDARPPVLISDQAERPGGYEGHWVSLAGDCEAISQQSDLNPVSAAAPENLAYIIYTSGSTGAPKGVLVTHANVTRLFTAAHPLFHFDHTDVWTLFHSYAFDFSVWEIWGALLHGGRLVVVPYLVSRSPERFYELLVAERVSVLNQTPSAFRQLIAIEAEQARDLALRTVIFGGEALQSAMLVPWFERHGDKPRLVNMYGITETTVHVTCSPLSTATDAGLGAPLADLQVYLLDRQLQPVPAGVVGEICVGGAGVTRGYLGRPDLTAARFVPDPFSQVGGKRLYRSGDLGRYRSDGRLEYLGRADQQVKLRGFRIEPGEIEAALLLHPAIQEAAVLVETGDGEGRLVAYLVVGRAAPPTANALYSYLKQKLPAHMLPGAFVVLEKLPLTANGKLDRKAIPGLGTGLAPGEGREARTPTEALLADIWAQVLRVERVGVTDDFFALGGHSLSATQVIARVRTHFKVELPLHVLFAEPTVASLAHQIDKIQQEATGGAPPPLLPTPRTQPVAASFAQQRLWFLDQLTPGNAAYNISAALLLTGALDAAALEAAFNEMIRRHEGLRTNFVVRGEQVMQEIAQERTLTLAHVDLQHLEGDIQADAAQQLVLDAAACPFKLERDLLVRATLVQLAPTRQVLIFVMHHIISDAWSMEVMTQEVAALYTAFYRGATSPLPPLAVQYADFALWQRNWLSAAVLEAQVAYWRQQLAGLTVLQLPTDRPRPERPSFRGAMQSLSIPRTLVEGVEALSREHDVTPFMTLLATFQVLLHRYTGQDDIPVGTPVAGRTRVETEALIGFFVNSLVLRGDLSGQPNFLTLLGRVRKMALEAYAHQEVPFEKLVEALQRTRDPGRHPLFQVFFVYNNIPQNPIDLPELAVQPFEVDSGYKQTAKFDLELSVVETQAGLSAVMNYSTDLFDKDTIIGMLDHLKVLLEAVVASPEQTLLDIALPKNVSQKATGDMFSFQNADQFTFEL